MEIGATLAKLELSTSDPQKLADFYSSAFKLEQSAHHDSIVCSAPGRELVFVPGEGGQLKRASFCFKDVDSLSSYRSVLLSRGVELIEDKPHFITLSDPHGHLVSFFTTDSLDNAPLPDDARLQHFALRTPEPTKLAEFYTEKLGFVVSDRVLNDVGELTAIFMRTDAEHHAMAIFRAPMIRFDHLSCEVIRFSGGDRA